MSETLLQSKCHFPYPFINIRIDRGMHILMLHYIEILVRNILTFVFFYPHQKLAIDYLLSVLMRSYTRVDELNQLTHIFTFDNVWHYLRHNIPDTIKILRLELYNCPLQELHKISFNYLGIVNRLLPCIERTDEFVQFRPYFADLTNKKLLKPVNTVALIKLEVRKQFQQQTKSVLSRYRDIIQVLNNRPYLTVSPVYFLPSEKRLTNKMLNNLAYAQYHLVHLIIRQHLNKTLL
jgi:hypothetical protein